MFCCYFSNPQCLRVCSDTNTCLSSSWGTLEMRHEKCLVNDRQSEMVAFVTIYFEKKNPNLTSEELTEMSFLQFGQNSKEQKGGKSILKQYSGKGWSSLLISLSLSLQDQPRLALIRKLFCIMVTAYRKNTCLTTIYVIFLHPFPSPDFQCYQLLLGSYYLCPGFHDPQIISLTLVSFSVHLFYILLLD